MKRVLIYGAYDLDNLGDDYMMYHIDQLLKENSIKPIYLSYARKPINYFNMYNKDILEIPIYTKYKRKITKLKEIIKWYFNKKDIKDIDTLVFMGGGYTNEKFGLVKVINMFILAKKFKRNQKKIYFTGQTVGPISTKIYKFFFKKLYKCADRIIVREKYSHEYLNALNIKNELIGDDAYLTDNYENKIENKDKIIFNYKDFSGYEEYKEVYFNLLLEIALKMNKEVWVIPFRSSEKAKEYKINKELYLYLSKNNVKTKFIVENDIEKFKEIFRTSELVVGTAYHSIVLGLLFGNKVYGFYLGEYYKMKINGILGWYGLSDTNCVDIREIENKKDKILDKILNEDIAITDNKRNTKKLINNVHSIWHEFIRNILLGE